MKTHIIGASGAAILLALGGSALAQDSGSGGDMQQNQAAAGQQRGAGDVLCREITALDTRQVPGVLYYISGYAEGERAAGGGMDQSADAGAAQTPDANAGGQSGDASTDTAAASPDAGTDAGADTTGSTTGDAAASADASGGSDAGSGGATPQIVAISGYFDIPVEQTMIACGQEPESRASDVLQRQRGGGQGSAGQQ